MVTAFDAQFSTYNTFVAGFQAEVYNDGDIVIESRHGERLLVNVTELRGLLAEADDYLTQHKECHVQHNSNSRPSSNHV